jgi:hypothetical protein
MACRKKIFVSKIVLLVICLLTGATGFGQTWAEWFEQKKTQIQYLEKQIAELQILITEVEKGYQVVQKGLQVISDIKHGDFKLHSGYFTSLMNANPAIGQSSTVKDCYALQTQIVSACQTLGLQVTGSALFASSEKGYLQSVIQSLQARTTATMGDLSSLTSDGNFGLKDEQRQQRITAIHATILTQYQFIQHFSAQVRLFGAQRSQDNIDAQSIQQMYSLP